MPKVNTNNNKWGFDPKKHVIIRDEDKRTEGNKTAGHYKFYFGDLVLLGDFVERMKKSNPNFSYKVTNNGHYELLIPKNGVFSALRGQIDQRINADEYKLGDQTIFDLSQYRQNKHDAFIKNAHAHQKAVEANAKLQVRLDAEKARVIAEHLASSQKDTSGASTSRSSDSHSTEATSSSSLAGNDSRVTGNGIDNSVQKQRHTGPTGRKPPSRGTHGTIAAKASDQAPPAASADSKVAQVARLAKAAGGNTLDQNAIAQAAVAARNKQLARGSR